MTERAPAPRRALPLLACLLAAWVRPPAALAVGQVDTPGQGPETIQGLAAQLASGERAQRRYAARSLRTWARIYVRQSSRSGGDPLTRDEARAELETFDLIVAPACVEALAEPALVVACADLLGMLQTAEARTPLSQALATEPRRRARRHLADAIAAIDAAGDR